MSNDNQLSRNFLQLLFAIWRRRSAASCERIIPTMPLAASFIYTSSCLLDFSWGNGEAVMRSHPLNGHMEEDFTVLETRTLNISPKPLFAKLDELVSNRQRAEAAGEKAAYVEQLDREIANLLRVFVEMGGRMRRDKGAVTLCVPRLSQAEPGEL